MLLLCNFIISKGSFLFYSDEASRIRKKLRGDRHVDLQSPLSKGPTGDKNKDEDPGGDESNSELKRKA
jgi:hypothetical protein